jgi:hypothetical protein
LNAAQMISPELRAMLAPAATFTAAMEASSAPTSWWIPFARPALFAFIVGAVTSICSTGRVTWSLVLGGTICWSFAPALQAVVASVVLSTARHPPASLANQINWFFIGQGPWALWLLTVAAWSVAVPIARQSQWPILISAVVPAAWTALIVFKFFRTVFRYGQRKAVSRTCLHQGLIWLLIAAYITLMNQLWPRLVGLLER